jgi:hypothetical protein
MPAIEVTFTLDNVREGQNLLGLLEDQAVRDKAIETYGLGTVDKIVTCVRQALSKTPS